MLNVIMLASSIRRMPEGFGAVEFQNITNVHPLALVIVLVLGSAMLAVHRRWSFLPMLIIACFISAAQKITVFGMDFNFLRIMVLFGLIRLFIYDEYRYFEWKPLDVVLVLWTVSAIVIHVLQRGTFASFVNRLGFGFDAFGMYFLFRCLVRDWRDVDHIIWACILISIPVALFFIFENRVGRNVFSVFGGISPTAIVREGRVRCRGAYAHPIIAGCFWASLMPLIAAYRLKSAKHRTWSIIGLINSMIIVICCSSSTPLMGVMATLMGGLLYVVRRYMRTLRWGILLTLCALHLVMLAPVWHLIGRFQFVGGSTSYFRFLVIDSAIKNFNEWALLGTQSTAHWFWGAQDLTNHFVMEGVMGGFLTLCLFVAVIAYAFRDVGGMWRAEARNSCRAKYAWALGVCIFVHCVNFIGVSYFGQIIVVWYLHLAIIGSLSAKKRAAIISNA